MPKFLLRTIPALIFLGIFIWVVLFVDYPKSLTQASTLQLAVFFVTLFLCLTFLLNIAINKLITSSIISLGGMILLILKALAVLNFVTGILTILAIYLLASYFKKSHPNLTYTPNIPKLTRLIRRKHG